MVRYDGAWSEPADQEVWVGRMSSGRVPGMAMDTSKWGGRTHKRRAGQNCRARSVEVSGSSAQWLGRNSVEKNGLIYMGWHCAIMSLWCAACAHERGLLRRTSADQQVTMRQFRD
jgi:hypothetical protein